MTKSRSGWIWRAALAAGWLMALASVPAAVLLPMPIGLVLVLAGAVVALAAERCRDAGQPASEVPDPRPRRWHILLLVFAAALALLFLIVCEIAPRI